MISVPAYNPDNPTHFRLWRYAQVKRDGLFLRIRKDRLGAVRAYTRHPTDITEQVRRFPFFGHAVQHLSFMSETWGELWSPGSPASHVKSVLAGNCGNEQLSYDVFAVPGVLDDWARLDAVNDVIRLMNQRVPQTLTRYETHAGDLGSIPTDNPYWIPSLEDLPVDQEGWVLKGSHMRNWFKLKPVKTLDLVVKDLQPGKGKYAGMVGALHVAVVERDGVLREVARVSGMDDETRSTVDGSWIGTVVEVAYQYVGSGGRLRHPRFVRRRDDKHPSHEDCGPHQDEELK